MAAAPPIEGPAVPQPTRGYANYVLTLLVIVYILNFIDRQILAILAEDIKRDLGLSDADIGFLYGTAFGVFYSLFGIPLGRLADSWNRVKLLSAGLAIWSAATAASAFARTGGMLTGARIGVGIGEATASPCAYSLISDYFPQGEAGHRARNLLVRNLHRGRPVALHRRRDRRKVESRLSGRRPARPRRLAGCLPRSRHTGPAACRLDCNAARAAAGASRRHRHAAKRTSLPGVLRRAADRHPAFTLIGAARRGMAALAINLLAAASIAFLVHILVANTGGWSSTRPATSGSRSG
jgi:hypothetical protein